MDNKVTVFEVGPRDGLQNEKREIDLDVKISLVDQLSDAGFTKIEAGSFVSPKWVPQMATSGDVFAGISRQAGVSYAALTPNLRGMEAALKANASEVAIFGAASESFSQKNINCSIEESLERFEPVIDLAKQNGIPVRGYVSCVVGCPYEGEIQPQEVLKVVKRLLALGCYEVSLGDTIGVATPKSINNLLRVLLTEVSSNQLAMHCHDTYGQAIANIVAALELGIRTIDSSVAGLGGCPYAKGASGNVATEDVLYLLQGQGMDTGIDLDRAITAGNYISKALGRQTTSNVALARS